MLGQSEEGEEMSDEILIKRMKKLIKEAYKEGFKDAIAHMNKAEDEVDDALRYSDSMEKIKNRTWEYLE
jgi:hypothetical protein